MYDFLFSTGNNKRTLFFGFFQIEKGEMAEIQMPILPVVDDCFTVTVTANAVLYTDTETLEICTKVRNSIFMFLHYNFHVIVRYSNMSTHLPHFSTHSKLSCTCFSTMEF